MHLDELLHAVDDDREEALRLLFVMARASAGRPEGDGVLSGPQLAALLAALLEVEPPTAVEAVEPIPHGRDLELPTDELRYGRPELLGAGGMGAVHRVYDRRLRRSVARKVLHGGVTGRPSAQRFALEAQLTAQLDHPNIVPIYDFGRAHDGELFFTMKEVRGRCLSDVIDDVEHAVRTGTAPYAVSLPRLLRIFRCVCDAVAYAHSQGIVHRDLKPDNVMVGDFGEVRVMDWGLAQEAGSAAGPLAGTPAYMAPEVAQRRADMVGCPQDIYALGATLRHILSFVPPTPAPADLSSAPSHPAPGPSASPAHAVPPELAEVCLRAMAPRAEDRYANASELTDDVQAWLDGRPWPL